MEFEAFKNRISEKASKINVNISDEQIKQFFTYMNLLIEWNQKINLTSIIEPEDIILKHFIDSLTIEKYISPNSKVADIGTGAGFPGIPLKLVRPELKIYLIDSLNKKIKFLDEVIQKNEMKQIYAIHARAEEIGHNKQFRGQFDVVTSRAVAKLNVLLEYMMPLLKIGGKCICLKGPNIKEELEEAKNAIEILGGKISKIEEIYLPDSDNKRTIIEIIAVKHLPNKYPRKPGTPTNSPI